MNYVLIHEPLPLPQVSSGNVKGFPQENPKDRMHISFLAGIRIIQRDRDPEKYSGYQVSQNSSYLSVQLTQIGIISNR